MLWQPILYQARAGTCNIRKRRGRRGAACNQAERRRGRGRGPGKRLLYSVAHRRSDAVVLLVTARLLVADGSDVCRSGAGLGCWYVWRLFLEYWIPPRADGRVFRSWWILDPWGLSGGGSGGAGGLRSKRERKNIFLTVRTWCVINCHPMTPSPWTPTKMTNNLGYVQ
jgi:hypothetical protein